MNTPSPRSGAPAATLDQAAEPPKRAFGCRDTALHLADARGWRFFPLFPVADGRCTCWKGHACKSAGKHPIIPNAHRKGDPLKGTCRGECGRRGHGVLDASSDPATITAWFEEWPDANLGLATGEGLTVIDVDPRHDGYASLAALEAAHSPDLVTLEVVTQSGGSHLYFAFTGENLSNSAGRLGDGLDVRNSGGYVVAPPSVGLEGAYRWVRPQDVGLPAPTIKPLPEWVAELLAERNEPPTATNVAPGRLSVLARRDGPRSDRYWQAAVVDEVDQLARVPVGVGKRHAAVRGAACRFGQLIVSAGAPDDYLTDLLVDIAGEMGQEARVVHDGIAFGMRNPRRARA